MLTVKQLIAHLEAMATPDAAVFAGEEGRAPFMILGGVPGETSGGQQYVLLGPMSLSSQEGGF